MHGPPAAAAADAAVQHHFKVNQTLTLNYSQSLFSIYPYTARLNQKVGKYWLNGLSQMTRRPSQPTESSVK